MKLDFEEISYKYVNCHMICTVMLSDVNIVLPVFLLVSEIRYACFNLALHSVLLLMQACISLFIFVSFSLLHVKQVNASCNTVDLYSECAHFEFRRTML